MLSATKQTMAFTQMGLADLIESEDRARQVKGVADVVTYGRAVTNVLAHIATFDDPGWNAWWTPRAAKMFADPLCRFFYECRTIVLKDGTLPIWETNRLEGPDIGPPMTFAPLGSTAALPDAASLPHTDYFKSSHIETRVFNRRVRGYVPLPTKQSDRMLLLANPPTEHNGGAIVDTSAQMLCTLYVAYLSDLVRDAIAQFAPASSSSSA